MLAVGEHERLKASVHVAVGVLAAVCAVYNALAWWRRRQPHLAINTVMYSALVVYEARQVDRHLNA